MVVTTQEIMAMMPPERVPISMAQPNWEEG